MTRKKWLLVALFALIALSACRILYIKLHSTPSLAIRTRLFFTLHPNSALTSKISSQARENKGFQPYLHIHNAKAYRINHPVASLNLNDLKITDFIVYRKGSLFFAEYLDTEIADIEGW
ncbi:hypothetical protein ACFCYN_22640 [Gottfriedia sp. NPDC056225]|uniref:hypothetical protein n=1 Tax=Gottfriedia sp. NPDC056225 TaxID=3345751 RepID=UPI0035D5ED3C